MLSRQSLLRVMIGCLALTALMGIAGVFVGGWDLLGRLMGTAVLGAAASLLMLRAGAWMEHPATRRAGLLSMAVTLGIFVSLFAAIWTSWSSFPLPAPSSETLIFTAIFIGLTGAPAVRFVAALEKPALWLASRVGLVIDAVVFIMLMAALWLPLSSSGGFRLMFSDAGSRLAASAGTLAGHGLVVVLCLVDWTRGDRRWWRWIGVAALAVGCVGLVVGIWLNRGGDPTPLFVIASVGVAVAHANLMLLVPLRAGQNWLRAGTIVAAALTIVLADALALMKIDQDVMLARVTAAVGIVAVCGTLAMLVLARINRGHAAPPQEAGNVVAPGELVFPCPVCNKPHTARHGASSCAGCGLMFNVFIQVPRCAACGYVLLHNPGKACPECGSAGGPAPIATPAAPPML